jgi:hypothetical protein
MLTSGEVGGHFLALVLIWLAACLPGFVVTSLLPPPLRQRDGWASWPLLGVAWWACALYVFCFAGGLWVAGGLAALAGLWLLWQNGIPRVRYSWRALGVLALGASSFATPLFTQHAPPGMDATLHTANSRFLAQHAGLAKNYAPMTTEVSLPAVNLGMPTVTAVAILLGAQPAAASLASEQLAYACLILALYLLLRLIGSRPVSAVLAVGVVWLARASPAAFCWGGYPTVMGLAVAVFAARLVVDVPRRGFGPGFIPLGLCLASLPLIQGNEAAVWIYLAMPAAGAAAMALARKRWAALASLTAAGTFAGIILLVYLLQARPTLDDAVRMQIWDWQQASLPAGIPLWALVPDLLLQNAGRTLIAFLLLPFVLLAWRRCWRSLAMTAWLGLVFCLLIANARAWLLPASPLLYPDRIVPWVEPLTALVLVLAWRAWRRGMPLRPVLAALLAIVFLGFAFTRHKYNFQREAFRPVIDDDSWAALAWAGTHLDPARAFVIANYNSPGAYLPAVAGILPSCWHIHFMQEKDHAALWGKRPYSHHWVMDDAQTTDAAPGRVVFHQGRVTIRELARTEARPPLP